MAAVRGDDRPDLSNRYLSTFCPDRRASSRHRHPAAASRLSAAHPTPIRSVQDSVVTVPTSAASVAGGEEALEDGEHRCVCGTRNAAEAPDRGASADPSSIPIPRPTAVYAAKVGPSSEIITRRCCRACPARPSSPSRRTKPHRSGARCVTGAVARRVPGAVAGCVAGRAAGTRTRHGAGALLAVHRPPLLPPPRGAEAVDAKVFQTQFELVAWSSSWRGEWMTTISGEGARLRSCAIRAAPGQRRHTQKAQKESRTYRRGIYHAREVRVLTAIQNEAAFIQNSRGARPRPLLIHHPILSPRSRD